MSNAVLYGLFKQIPNATDEQVEKAVESVASAKEVVTKDYLDARLAKLETELKYLRWFIALGFSLTIAILKLL